MERTDQTAALDALGLEPLIEQIQVLDGTDFKVSVVLNERIFCIAFDSKDGSATLASLEKKHGKMPTTWCQITPEGGLQYYFKGHVRSKHCKSIGVDIFGKGTTLVISDVDYAWQLGRAPGKCELAKMPEWLDGFFISNPFVETPFVLAAVPTLLNNVSALIPETRKPKAEPLTFPIPIGVWGDLYWLCLARANNPVPELAMAASSAIMSAILQRTVRPHRGGNVNAYVYVLTPSSGGKNSYINFVEEVLEAVNPKLLFPKVQSASALQECLADYPSGISVIDEATEALKAVFGSTNQQDKLAQQKNSLNLSLWSAISNLKAVKVRAKGMSIAAVKDPRYSEFAVGVTEEFEKVIASDVAQNGGFLSRIELYISDKFYVSRMKAQEDMTEMEPIPQSLIERLKALQGPLGFLTEEAGNVPVLQKARLFFDGESHRYFRTIEDELEGLMLRATQGWEKNWYNRVAEKIERDATKHAAGQFMTYVSLPDLLFAEAKQAAHTQRFFTLMSEAPVSDFDGARRDVLKVLAQHGPMLKSQLRAKCYSFKKLNLKLQKELLEDLADTLEIAITHRKTGSMLCLVKNA